MEVEKWEMLKFRVVLNAARFSVLVTSLLSGPTAPSRVGTDVSVGERSAALHKQQQTSGGL